MNIGKTTGGVRRGDGGISHLVTDGVLEVNTVGDRKVEFGENGLSKFPGPFAGIPLP